ncbi:MAG: SusC/RagA family TonB-linked outer membrane protein [Prevotellaceae bacterium]|jgi:TonB-linked SusC/RagA family outer membrane protein|nr:SusC/RagA family TonB-linked outer membrane protein [Prevotellaceae bacterium]
MKLQTQKKLVPILCFISLLLGLSMQQVMAQSTITGKVTDTSTGEPIPFASVVIKGTTIGVNTDENGMYSIPMLANETTLRFSSVGYENREEEINGRTIINVALKIAAETLEEVVVTGYGNFRKSTYTGAATVVSMKKLHDSPVVSATKMLESHVPGLSLLAGSGQAGATSTLRIRGQGSVNASSAPLIVLDGVPILNVNFSSDGNVSSVGMDAMSAINPNDIESITVLKDATSTSLYGARGSNGVILITTKKGGEGKTNFSFRANTSIDNFAVDYRPTMGGEERRELIYEGFLNYYTDVKNLSEADARVEADKLIDNYAKVPEGGYSDWRDAVLKKGHTSNLDLSINGGNKNTKFSASLGYSNNKGVSLSSAFKRYTGRMNMNHIFKKFDFNMMFMFSYADTRLIPEDTYYAGAIYPIVANLTPSQPIYNADGSYAVGFPTNGGYNPLHEDANTIAYSKVGRLIGNVGVGYKIIEPVHISSTLNVEYNNVREFRFWNPNSNDGRTKNGVGQLYTPNYMQLTSKTTMSYQQNFGKHQLNGSVTFEARDYEYNYSYSRKENYGYWGNPAQSNATEPVSISGYTDIDRAMSWIGVMNYNYNNRFYLSGTFNSNSSSRLSSESRWGNFWSLSGSWQMANESFMKPLSHWLTSMRLKASYGSNGNLPDGWYAYHSLFAASGQYGSYPSLYENTLGNNKLTWEKGIVTNIGIDVTFLRRINLEVDFYQRDTKDLLIQRSLFRATGFSSVWDNIGHIRNSGIEVTVNSVNIDKKDFRWTSNLNIYHNKNKIIKLNTDGSPIYDGRMIRAEGEAWSTFYVREFAGVDVDNGDPLYYSNEEIIDQQTGKISRSREIVSGAANATPIAYKNAEPTIRGGLTNTFTYKFIDLSFHLSFHLGGHTLDNRWELMDDGYTPNSNKSIELRKRWKKPGDVTDVPKYVAYSEKGGWYTTSYKVHSTNHLRLKNLTIGLRAPDKWLKVVGISSARIYFSGQNLLTWTGFKLYDPELWGSHGVSIPPLKSYSFGIDISF